jgi:subtilisin family serine protease
MSSHSNRRPRWLAIAVALLTAIGAVAVGGSASAGPTDGGDATVVPSEIRYADQPTAVPDTYVVVLKNTESPDDTERVARELTAKYNGSLLYTYTAALQGFALNVSADRAALIAGEPAVDYVAQDQEVTADWFVQPGPPSWGLDRIDEHSLPLDAKYHYPSTGSTARAFVIDTGILMTHQEFGGRAACGFDPWGLGCAPCNQIHGTHVAGTIGGRTVGVAKGIQIVSVRVFQCAPVTTWAIVIAGVNYVTFAHSLNPAARDVANMSLGGPAFAPVDLAVANSIAGGVHYSVSAGNANTNACLASPARVPTATTVGATTITDNRAAFSNVGTCVDVFAPGERITSASAAAINSYAALSGTSMAAPHAAGTAALWRHRFPTDTPAQVHNALNANATPGVVINPGPGSPNLLLFSNMIPM